MYKSLSALLPAFLALAAALPTAAQEVVISEINLEAQDSSDDQWIELVNIGTKEADISNWSLYLATNTVGRAGNYWWGVPPGTKIAPGKYLRVHWFVPIKASTPTDVYTGNTLFHFLFGYGAEALPKTAGALAVLNTTQNLKMNDPSSFVDWVSWGVNGLKREDIAIAAGLWTKGEQVGAAQFKDSIAIDLKLRQKPGVASSWFHDATPSPLAPNAALAATTAYGTSCSIGANAAATLSAVSTPAPGNRDFGLNVSNTNAGDVVALLLTPKRGDGSFLFGPCKVWIDIASPIVAIQVGAQAGSTDVPVPLLDPAINGGSIALQAVVVSTPSDLSFSNGLEVIAGVQ